MSEQYRKNNFLARKNIKIDIDDGVLTSLLRL